MVITLTKKSGIFLLKSKFFISRALIYSTVLLLPIWIPKTVNLPTGAKYFFMTAYLLFMAGQWFMLGKEIDHRFKIFFRVNSSLDRIIYRTVLGISFLIILFNLINLLPHKWANNSFFITWLILGLFYSWPTRGKIIKESVTSNFGEFKHLDAFERILLGLIVLYFVVSIPIMSGLLDYEALKLFFDPYEKASQGLWGFLHITYIPFNGYPELNRVALSSFFYLTGLGGFLTILYALLRFCVSRRVAMLGVFALISSWSYSKILADSPGSALFSTFTLLWVWATLWIIRSGSYRVGLFWGMLLYWSVLLNKAFAFLGVVQIIVVFYYLRDKTKWFRKKIVKYTLFGGALAVATILLDRSFIEHHVISTISPFTEIIQAIERKAFFILAVPGLMLTLLFTLLPDKGILRVSTIDHKALSVIAIMALIACQGSFILDEDLFSDFGVLWVLTFLSLLPIETIFQTINRLRSRRNIIYFLYILVCLVDSHLEGRIKILIKSFNL